MHRTKVLFAAILSSYIMGISAQETSLEINLNEVESNVKREEIQRYFGYETLMPRYLTMPYDISVNVNQQGRFVDIGYILFALIPLGLLGISYRSKKLFYSLAVFFILYLSIAFKYSFLVLDNLRQVWVHSPQWAALTRSELTSASQKILKTAYDIFGLMATPFVNLFESISGDKDHITYPLIFGLLVVTIFFILRNKSLKKENLILTILLLSYGFLWLVLSGGIVWYGFLMLPLGLILMSKLITFDSSIIGQLMKYIGLATIIFWGTNAYVSRISNIYAIGGFNKEHIGKSILDGNIYKYSTGILNASQTVNSAYRNLNGALDKINSNDGLVYQIGTSLAFEINDNPRRVYSDAGLNLFFVLINLTQDKQRIIEVFKRSNIRYIVVDLNTHTIDKTPEQSLREKFTLLLNTLIKNPRVQLIATDRIYNYVDSNGETHMVADVFPPDNQRNPAIETGSYAIYEIL